MAPHCSFLPVTILLVCNSGVLFYRDSELGCMSWPMDVSKYKHTRFKSGVASFISMKNICWGILLEGETVEQS